MRAGYVWAGVCWAASPGVAWGADAALFAGARDSVSEAGLTQGVQGGLRLGVDRWEVAIGGFARLRPEGPTGLTRVLVDRVAAAGVPRDVVVPEDSDRQTLYALASFGPVATDQRWWGAPRLVAGGEARWVARRTYRFEGGAAAEVEQSALFGGGPVVGVAFDARLGSPLGVRLSVLDRLWFGSEQTPTGDGIGDQTGLIHSPTFTLDLSWSL